MQQDFINAITELGLCQINNIWNTNNRLLDLVFTNDPRNAEISKPSPLVAVEGYHPPVLVTFEWHFNDTTSDFLPPTHNFNEGKLYRAKSVSRIFRN